jgi:hypothetical protein
MTVYAHDDFADQVLMSVEIHDLLTGNNWIAEIAGTAGEAWCQWLRTERLLAQAGFSTGWRPHGAYCGTIDHLVLVKEAVDRCWLRHAADLVP